MEIYIKYVVNGEVGVTSYAFPFLFLFFSLLVNECESYEGGANCKLSIDFHIRCKEWGSSCIWLYVLYGVLLLLLPIQQLYIFGLTYQKAFINKLSIVCWLAGWLVTFWTRTLC